MRQISSIKRYNRIFGGDVVQAEHGEMVFYSDLVSLLDAHETQASVTSELVTEYGRGWRHGVMFGGAFVIFMLAIGVACEFIRDVL